jgi:acyl-CoA dehydrogenase
VRDGDHYVINGRKWYISGAPDERGLQDPDRHGQDRSRQSDHPSPAVDDPRSDRDTPGVRIVRATCKAFGYDHAPGGHPEIVYDNVRVPATNIILGEGRGFEIAQGRLGPGRIHHCMRLIGCAQRALEMMCRRRLRAWPSTSRWRNRE